MSPVRKVQGKHSTAASGSATLQNASITTVRIMAAFLPRVGLHPLAILRGRDFAQLRQLQFDFLPCFQRPMQLTLGGRVADTQVNRIARKQRRKMPGDVVLQFLAVDLENRISYGQAGTLG